MTVKYPHCSFKNVYAYLHCEFLARYFSKFCKFLVGRKVIEKYPLNFLCFIRLQQFSNAHIRVVSIRMCGFRLWENACSEYLLNESWFLQLYRFLFFAGFFIYTAISREESRRIFLRLTHWCHRRTNIGVHERTTLWQCHACADICICQSIYLFLSSNLRIIKLEPKKV